MRNLRQKPTISHKKPAPGASKWDARLLERTKMAADKKLTRELQEAKEADRERVKQINLERKRKQEEKARMLAAAEKMSAKRLQRLKKKLGRTKKINA